MSDYTAVRLEKTGVVVAYLAPNAQVSRVTKSQLVQVPRKAAPARTFDYLLVIQEVTVQGQFLARGELPANQVAALDSLFGNTTWTPEDQMNRIEEYVAVTGSPFDFYNRTDEYTATTDAGVDVAGGVYPQVWIDEVRSTWNSGHGRVDYSMKLLVGLDRASGGQ